MVILYRIISAAIGYLCGCILFGYFYSKAKHDDVTQKGSGNAGATNIMRNFGWQAALLTLLGDAFKVVAAIMIVYFLFRGNEDPELYRVLELYAGAGAIVGHNHPFYRPNFKGGKGISSTAGLMLAFCPIEIPVCFVIFVMIVALTRYVSLASIMVCIAFFVQMLVFGQNGWLFVTDAYRIEIYVLAAFIMCSGIIRHKENIGRLLNGNENKFKFK